MATRLDRLFVLLDSGSSSVTRKAAATQLGEVQKLHPHELHNLLAKVLVYLRSESWDTRIAAGCAVEAIAKNVPQWRPIKTIKEEPSEASPITVERDPADRLEFAKFNVAKVLEHGASLLGSSGAEYEQESDTGMDPKERLQMQRKMLQKRLGLGMAGALGMETDDLFNDDDLLVKKTSGEEKSSYKTAANAAELIAKEMANINPGMSSREKNRAKRRARVLAKQRSKDGDVQASSSSDKSSSVPPVKKAKLSIEQVEGIAFQEEPGEWCFTSFCEQLTCDLFHTSWEVRHGAATGIREVVKAHGQSAGRSVQYPLDQQDALNKSWLEDMALRLMCVLALDRFGDFISDEVVAPVRETCAQALGVVLSHMTTEDVQGVMSILLKLQEQPQWETRHGGLLGLKYLLAVRQEMTNELLQVCLPFIVSGLQDVDDDVRAVASAALIPVTSNLTRFYPDQIPPILVILWDTLLYLDDLTASTSSIMMLLASLLSEWKSRNDTSLPGKTGLPGDTSLPGNSSDPITGNLTELVPRLWPFLSHNSTSVRKAVLNTLLALLGSGNQKISNSSWLLSLLPDALRHIYQRCILETSSEIITIIEKVWDALLVNLSMLDLSSAALPFFNMWLCLAMQQQGVPLDQQMLILAKHKAKDVSRPLGKSNKPQPSSENEIYYIAGDPGLATSQDNRKSRVLQTRLHACRLLGRLAASMSRSEEPVESCADTLRTLGEILEFHLKFKSAVQIMVIALVIDAWARVQKDCRCINEPIIQLLNGVSNGIYYDEVAPLFMRLQSECKAAVTTFLQVFPNMPSDKFPSGFGVDEAEALVESISEVGKSPKVSSSVKNEVDNRCKQIQATLEEIDDEQQRLKTRTMACMASALVLVKALPRKLTPVIRPLMDAIKTEQEAGIQERAANGLAHLIETSLTRNPCPNAKIIRNLVTSLCCDSRHTPSASEPLSSSQEPSGGVGSSSDAENSQSSSRASSPSTIEQQALVNKKSGILTLAKQQQQAALTAAIRRNIFSRHRLRSASITDFSNANLDPSDESICEQNVQRRGAQIALTEVAQLFGSELFDKVEIVRLVMTKALTEQIDPSIEVQTFQELDNVVDDLISGLQAFETLTSVVHDSLHPQILMYLPHLICCLGHPYTSVRHMSARCIGALAAVSTTLVMQEVILKVVSLLADVDAEASRQGAMECVTCVVDALGMDIVPYIVLLVVPLMGAMSDQNYCVRHLATQCFATLIRLMPLESGIPDPPAMSTLLVEKKAKERIFLEQLFDANKLENFKVSKAIKAELRKYQQDGVNWLAFLNRYKLHGILCDDMGLGKTLMSICILAGEYVTNSKQSTESGSALLPSIVVCPPTLTGHWFYEVKQFCPSSHLRPLQYTGSPSERARLQKLVKKHNLVIASYDIVRNDIDFFRSINWKYCILDEGHIIKNGKTKLSKAIKQLHAAHRLILSGTPIQNNVLELWSLFDFLMPGFLGTEKQFQARYAKPILQSRDAKSSSREQEAGALAMEALHRQVLPFLLRRLKEDVLDDLPPKIIQDYYCDLSPLQIELYEDFSKSRAKHSIDGEMEVTKDGDANVPASAKSHIFQAIQYLRKVCNHPLLVLNEKHPKYREVTENLNRHKSSLHDIMHAPKLAALRQLLQDCGVGVESQTSVVGQHRILLFCQLKSMLDIVENDLLKTHVDVSSLSFYIIVSFTVDWIPALKSCIRTHMPSVTYLRLDGSVPANQRHGVVQRFNNDPSIDILLLTTHVGGLGLNLTGADTVIFVEHDWNPTKDLQAMDRAHRIGQKKVVNVYRLITKGTLEEKIMGLQKFKLNIANTVISQENSSLQSMGTDQLLDLFNLNKDSEAGSSDKAEAKDSGKSSMQSVLNGLDELWDSSQYTDEYNLDEFINSLK